MMSSQVKFSLLNAERNTTRDPPSSLGMILWNLLRLNDCTRPSGFERKPSPESPFLLSDPSSHHHTDSQLFSPAKKKKLSEDRKAPV